ncbi:MAG: hypothetical protein JNG86_03285 [Verrucomicrobiaceae bacterium]|nr:hypothetical protein [Verrucomicrobiaceae bacterium]
MTDLLSIPGVQSACITDDSGHLVEHVGHAQPPTAAVLVLAHATLTAASELGRRSGSGDCVEILQQHEGGLILLRCLPSRHALLVRCLPGADISAVSRAAARIVAAPRLRPVAAPLLDLQDALHAMPAWQAR